MSVASTTSDWETTAAPDSRFERRLAEILDCATEIFADKGYAGASMRDLSRLSGTSLAGLYYYFKSKENLLYIIQRHTFTTIIARLRERLAASNDPEERIRIFVENHVDYALAKAKAMKLLSHEDDVLTNSYGSELAAIKREYYRICVGLVEQLVEAEQVEPDSSAISTRTAVMTLFGAINWLYTWHNPRVDPEATTLAREISDIFLRGIRGAAMRGCESTPAAKSKARNSAKESRR